MKKGAFILFSNLSSNLINCEEKQTDPVGNILGQGLRFTFRCQEFHFHAPKVSTVHGRDPAMFPVLTSMGQFLTSGRAFYLPAVMQGLEGKNKSPWLWRECNHSFGRETAEYRHLNNTPYGEPSQTNYQKKGGNWTWK